MVQSSRSEAGRIFLSSWTRAKTPTSGVNYDAAFRAEALRLAEQGRSTQAAARARNINPKLLYRWQQAQVVAEVGSEALARDPEMRALRAANKRLAQELERLQKAIAIFSATPPTL